MNYVIFPSGPPGRESCFRKRKINDCKKFLEALGVVFALQKMFMAMAQLGSDIAIFLIAVCTSTFFTGYLVAYLFQFVLRKFLPDSDLLLQIRRLKFTALLLTGLILAMVFFQVHSIDVSGLTVSAVWNFCIGFAVGTWHFAI
jgi:hypothetical protein